MLEEIWSGGQSGCDQAAWEVAAAAGLRRGGWIVPGFMTEAGPRPEFAQLHGAREFGQGKTLAAQYRLRAKANVRDTDGTLCFDLTGSTATDNAHADALELGKPFRCIMLDRTRAGVLTLSVAGIRAHEIAEWIGAEQIRVLNVAGNRASKVPDIGPFVSRYLAEVFRILKDDNVTP